MSSINELNLDYGHHVALTTGLGLSDKGVPLRLPALLIPGLRLLRELRSCGRSAEYTVYQATDFIIQANKLAPERAQECSRLTVSYLERFTKKYFPDVASNVSVLSGHNCLIDEDSLAATERELSKLVAGEPDDKEHPDTEAGSREALAKICAYGQSKGRKEAFFHYAAANVLLNAGHAGYYPFQNFKEPSLTTVVPIGGVKEAPFFMLTEQMAVATNCPYKIKTVTLDIGKMPVYYPCPDGDLLIGDDKASFKPPRRTKCDFKILGAIGADIDSLRRMSNDEVLKRPVSPTPKAATLQQAYAL